LLPLLSLLTVATILLVSELAARFLWPDQEFEICRVEDPVTGTPRFRPNCSSRVKIPEGPWVENRYNDCGYRTRESCAAKPAGAIRVAVLGTSFSYGYMSAYEDAYTTLVSRRLSSQCGRPVEFQNLGFPNYTLLDIYHRMDEALALKPDLILLSINPVDVRKEISAEQMQHRDEQWVVPKSKQPALNDSWLHKVVVAPLRASRALSMAQHFLFQDANTYLSLYLLYGDSAGYLRPDPSPAWRQRFENLDLILAAMAAKAHAASVPIVTFLGPQPSQVALLNTPPRTGLDAFAFTHSVVALAAKFDIRVVDPLPGMAGVQDPMSLFYVVDGHFGQRGQQILAERLDKGLLAGGYAAFSGCRDRPVLADH